MNFKNSAKTKSKAFFHEKYFLKHQLSIIEKFKGEKIDILISTSVTLGRV